MSVKNLAVALAVGVVSFLAVAVTVTELLSTRIWPSAIVGLPVGVLAGLLGVGATYYLLSRETAQQ
ncbi:hypothetical protein [Halorussus salinisoli]|uniref:hypothetical protein n=1 Tax=Halorussus salinisoli TaxID=2558242 RepID=UPI002A91DBE5|nr:hypothetical protein [Halorussus salinisoli]